MGLPLASRRALFGLRSLRQDRGLLLPSFYRRWQPRAAGGGSLRWLLPGTYNAAALLLVLVPALVRRA